MDQLSTSQAARLLNLSRVRVTQLADSGVLPCTKTPLGRLFDREDVERLAQEREQRLIVRRGVATAKGLRKALDAFEMRFNVPSAQLDSAFRNGNGELEETEDFHEWASLYAAWRIATHPEGEGAVVESSR